MDKYSGDTVNVSRYRNKLADLSRYEEQFNSFYCQPRDFSGDEIDVLFGKLNTINDHGGVEEISVLVDELKRFIDSGRMIEGFDVSHLEKPIIDILKNKELLFGKILPPNFIIPLYDLLKFRRTMMPLESLPLLADEEIITNTRESKYLERVILESDRYKTVIYVKFEGGGILFFPGRLFKWTDQNYLHEGVLHLDKNRIERIIKKKVDEGSLRLMSRNEQVSKIVEQENDEKPKANSSEMRIRVLEYLELQEA